MIKNVILSVLVSALVALGVASLNGGTTTVVKQVETRVGSLTGPVIQSTYLTVNGITHYYFKQTMGQATTTPCAIPAPSDATSTLVFANASWQVSSSTASSEVFAKATTPYATTTGVLATTTISANGLGTLDALATSTATTADIAQVRNALSFATSSYLVLGMAGGTGSFSPTGVCVAEFVSTR